MNTIPFLGRCIVVTGKHQPVFDPCSICKGPPDSSLHETFLANFEGRACWKQHLLVDGHESMRPESSVMSHES